MAKPIILKTSQSQGEKLSFNKLDQAVISEVIDNDNKGSLSFRLSNINVCFANAIRRTILSDIDVCCILSENFATNQVNIEKNTGILHNEILKHRLSCIPVHVGGTTEEKKAFYDSIALTIQMSYNLSQPKIFN
jgi:DNA-directed RNA polymerase alpha subunit